MESAVKSTNVLDLVNKTVELPTMPEVLVRLNHVIADPDISADGVAQVIAKGPAIATNVLRLVNSAYFGLQVRVSSVTTAVAIMGFRMTKKVALKAAVFSVFGQRQSKQPNFDPAAFWRHAAEGIGARALTLRLGGLPAIADELLDLLQHQVGDEWVMVTPAAGVMRWAGDATADRLRHLRRSLAALEVPLTLERAGWGMRSAVGHFGAFREGVGPLVSGLRKVFDPGQRLVVALTDDDRGA